MTSKKRVTGRGLVYRQRREEKSAKVYTINHESRYILVKEVPKISNIKGEVLKLFSLYGAIQEYRILDSHPDAEKFSTVFWIKYAHIQAARMAKRKMNKHSFYGVFLKVTYGPEYEQVDDTRQKLIERRRAVARRLHQLETTKQEESHQQVTYLASTSEDQVSQDEEDQNSNREERYHSGTNLPSLHLSERESTSLDSSQSLEQKFPELPLPPSHLPQTEWPKPTTEPDERPPRVPSAHATLPRGFDPFTECQNGHMTSTNSNFSKSKIMEGVERRKINDSEMYSSEGFVNLSHLKAPDGEVPSTSPWSFVGKKEVNSARSDPQGRQNIQGGARPKLFPRRRFAWNDNQSGRSTDTRNRFLGQRLNSPPSHANNPSFNRDRDGEHVKDAVRLQRQGLKRRAITSLQDEGPSTSSSSAAETGATSFDHSVLNIRQKMKQISQATPHHQVRSSCTRIPQEGSTQTSQVPITSVRSPHRPNNQAPSASDRGLSNIASSADASQSISVVHAESSHTVSRQGSSSTKRRRI